MGSTAKSLDAKMVESYANEIKLVAQGAQLVLISSDASVIYGENTMFYAAWWPEREQGGWLLPMVWWRWEGAANSGAAPMLGLRK